MTAPSIDRSSAATEMIQIFDPVSPRRSAAGNRGAARVDSLEGKRIGLLHNGKPGGEHMLAPEQARRVADSGLDPDEASRILFEYARIDMRGMPAPFRDLIRVRRPQWCDETRVPIVDRWEDIPIIVAGGPGIHALYLAGFGTTKSVTRRIESW